MRRIRAGVRTLDWAFIRGSSFNSLGIAISRVLGFAFSFVIAQAFSTDEFGRVTYIITLASVVAVLSQPFGQHVIAYFIGMYRDDAEKRQEILNSAWTIWLIMILLTLLVSTLILMAIDRFSVGLLVVYIGITAFYTYYGIASGFLASPRLLAVYLGSNIVQIILVVITVSVFHVQDGDPAIFIYGLAYFLPLAILIFRYPLPVRLSFSFNPANVRRILRFSVPIWIAHVLYMAYTSFDIIMLENFMSTAAVGVYALTKTLSSAFHFIPGGITMILMPKLAGMPKEGHNSILKVSLLVTIVINIIGGGLYLLLYQWFVITFFGAEYFVDMNFAFVMALAAILFGTYGVLTSFFVGSGRVSVQVFSRSIMMISLIVLSIALIPEQGVMGAALANLVSVVIGLGVYILVLIYISFSTRSAEQTPVLSRPAEQ
jgi:O-antigen/teichoic acid export membrane protein